MAWNDINKYNNFMIFFGIMILVITLSAGESSAVLAQISMYGAYDDPNYINGDNYALESFVFNDTGIPFSNLDIGNLKSKNKAANEPKNNNAPEKKNAADKPEKNNPSGKNRAEDELKHTPVNEKDKEEKRPEPIRTASISGYKINDTNGNGKWDVGEKGISGWTIEIMGKDG